MKKMLLLLIAGLNLIGQGQASGHGYAGNNNQAVLHGHMVLHQSRCYRSAGTVRKIDQDIRVVTIFHNAVHELGWPAMTMPFAVKDIEVFKKLKVGEHVEFEFEVGEKNSVIVGVR